MSLKASDGRLIIEEIEEVDEPGKIIRVISANKQAKPWRVVDVGPNTVFPHGSKSKCDFKRGDRVWVDLSMAYELSFQGKSYRVVEVPYVVAFLSE